jgi:hypothetical protein
MYVHMPRTSVSRTVNITISFLCPTWYTYVYSVIHIITSSASTCFGHYNAHLQEVLTVLCNIWSTFPYWLPCDTLVGSQLPTNVPTRWTTEFLSINTTVSVSWCQRSPNSFGVKRSRKEAVSRMLNPCPEFDISSQLHPAEEEHAVAPSVNCWLSTTLGELRWGSGCEGEFNPPTLVRGDERLLSEVTVAVLEVAVVDRCC